MITFEWDSKKAQANLRKHGISFDEAKSVFYDELAIQFYDDEALSEDRFVMLGLSNLSRVLVVVHCERGSNDELIRLISARKATSSERKYYQGEQQ